MNSTQIQTMTSFFHAYDLRGIYPSELGLDEARKIGQAWGTYIGDGEVIVGRDGRIHAEDVSEAFIDGVQSTGIDVVFAGLTPTPVIYFAADKMDYDGAAVVTASHNPPEYTGVKFCRNDGIAMSREGGMKQIEEIYTSENFLEGEGDLTKTDLSEPYIEHVKEQIEIGGNPDIAVNYGNGATGEIGSRLLSELGCNLTEINREIDGEFPNHLPSPDEEEAREQLLEVMDTHDLGVIFDGDGDRAGFIHPEAGYIDGDKMLAILSMHCLDQRKGDVVHGIRASRIVPEVIQEYGGEAVETRVGHTFISEAMHENPDVVFAGEVSGHYYFPLYNTPWDDGMFTAALMIKIATETDLAATLKELPEYPVSPELRIDCPEEAKQEVIDIIQERYRKYDLSTVDGVKVSFSDGWTLIRPSNTEPKISVRIEAENDEALERLSSEVEREVRDAIDKASG